MANTCLKSADFETLGCAARRNKAPPRSFKARAEELAA
jgi:hypothetical protein